MRVGVTTCSYPISRNCIMHVTEHGIEHEHLWMQRSLPQNSDSTIPSSKTPFRFTLLECRAGGVVLGCRRTVEVAVLHHCYNNLLYIARFYQKRKTLPFSDVRFSGTGLGPAEKSVEAHFAQSLSVVISHQC